MKIIPTSDIAIAGEHCATGLPVDVSERIGKELCDARLAVRAPEAAPTDDASVEANEGDAPAPKKARGGKARVETAAVETPGAPEQA